MSDPEIFVDTHKILVENPLDAGSLAGITLETDLQNLESAVRDLINTDPRVSAATHAVVKAQEMLPGDIFVYHITYSKGEGPSYQELGTCAVHTGLLDAHYE